MAVVNATEVVSQDILRLLATKMDGEDPLLVHVVQVHKTMAFLPAFGMKQYQGSAEAPIGITAAVRDFDLVLVVGPTNAADEEEATKYVHLSRPRSLAHPHLTRYWLHLCPQHRT